MHERHISTFSDQTKTAANLATASLVDDEYHRTITSAARYLANSGKGTASYETQDDSGTTVWTFEGKKLSVPVRLTSESYKDPYS